MAKGRKRVKSKMQSKSAVSPVMIGVVVVAAIAVVAGLMLLGNIQTRNATAPVDVSQFPVKGDADAAVTIIEYSDYG